VWTSEENIILKKNHRAARRGAEKPENVFLSVIF